MTREEAIDLLDNLIGMIEDNHNSDYDTAFRMAIKALEQEPCEDWYDFPADEMTFKQARQAVKDLRIMMAEYLTQEPKTWQFAEWVAREIFDEMWEYNKDAFAEIACRKLAKLGIVRAKGDEWELVEPQESEG